MRWTLAILSFIAVASVQAADPAPVPAPSADRAAQHEQMKASARERWKAADQDGNGSLSRAEAEASMPRLAQNFDNMDANGDGQIGADEMHNFKSAHPHHSRREMRKHFKAADKSGDGAIDLAEAQASLPMLAEHFAAVDADGNGLVTKAEMKAHHQGM
jgi:Ca2+-binding EF-hand superfamily protein